MLWERKWTEVGGRILWLGRLILGYYASNFVNIHHAAKLVAKLMNLIAIQMSYYRSLYLVIQRGKQLKAYRIMLARLLMLLNRRRSESGPRRPLLGPPPGRLCCS